MHERGTPRTQAADRLLHEDLTGSPLPYMQRLREIEHLTAEHERELADEWLALAGEASDPAEFARAWRTVAERRRFDEVNDLIGRHNRFFPIEARLSMDP